MGDPDLRDVYTNSDESGIPFERPAGFDGKRLEDVSELSCVSTDPASEYTSFLVVVR